MNLNFGKRFVQLACATKGQPDSIRCGCFVSSSCILTIEACADAHKWTSETGEGEIDLEEDPIVRAGGIAWLCGLNGQEYQDTCSFDTNSKPNSVSLLAPVQREGGGMVRTPVVQTARASGWDENSFTIMLDDTYPSSICGTVVWSEEGVLGVVSEPRPLQTGVDGEENSDTNTKMFKVARIKNVPSEAEGAIISHAAEHGFSDASLAWKYHLKTMEKEDECAPGMFIHILAPFVTDFKSPLKSKPRWSRPESPPELKDLMEHIPNSAATLNSPTPGDCIQACLNLKNLTNNHIVSSSEIVMGEDGCKEVIKETAMGLIGALMPLARGKKPKPKKGTIPEDSAVGVECREASRNVPPRPISLRLVAVRGKSKIQGRAACVPQLNAGFDRLGTQAAIDVAKKAASDLSNTSSDEVLNRWANTTIANLVGRLSGVNNLEEFVTMLRYYKENPSAEPRGWITPYIVIQHSSIKRTNGIKNERATEVVAILESLRENLQRAFVGEVPVYILDEGRYSRKTKIRDRHIQELLEGQSGRTDGTI